MEGMEVKLIFLKKKKKMNKKKRGNVRQFEGKKERKKKQGTNNKLSGSLHSEYTCILFKISYLSCVVLLSCLILIMLGWPLKYILLLLIEIFSYILRFLTNSSLKLE